MGGCLSSVAASAESHCPPTAKVVSANGSLSEYAAPVTASQVLEAAEGTSSSSSSSSSFICNSDRLYYDDYIPALDSEDQLEAGQLYFVLPRSKLDRRLTASDMAALAVRATLALQSRTPSSNNSETRKNPRRRHGRRSYNNKARISPVLTSLGGSGGGDDGYTIGPYKGQQREKALGLSKSGSVKKLQRYTSKRAKMAVRSFRLRLSTIYEGSVL